MSYGEYLKHHGIEGMRWGRRNGPPYPLLRRNMSSAEKRANPASSNPSDNETDSSKKKPERSVYVENENGRRTNPGAKSVKSMSDQELKDSLNRMQNEEKYREYAQNDISDGKSFIKNVLLAAGALGVTTFVTTLVRNGTQNGANAIVNRFKEKAASKGMKDLVSEFTGEDGKVDISKVKEEKSTLEMLKNIGELRKGGGKGK